MTFQDGEPFNAERGLFQLRPLVQLHRAGAECQRVVLLAGRLRRFKSTKENKALGKSLYASCEAVDDTTVTLKLTRPSASVLGALTLAPFWIASPKALTEYGADEGSLDADGVFSPTGTFGTEHPIGTGPFKFESWTGRQAELVRNEDYWGEKALLDKLIIRPIADNAARLQALQTGEIQGYDLVEPQDIPTIQGDSNLQIVDGRRSTSFTSTINQKISRSTTRGAAGGRLRTRPGKRRRHVLRRTGSVAKSSAAEVVRLQRTT